MKKRKYRSRKEVKKVLLSRVRVNERGCWEYSGCKNHKGYGAIQFEGRTRRTHRVSFIVFNREIPKGKLVCHHCDNPSCIKPDHLFLGTNLDNQRDCIAKGRARKATGEARATKLKWEMVYKIRDEYIPHKVTSTFLGKKYGVSNRTIIAIVKKEIWKD